MKIEPPLHSQGLRQPVVDPRRVASFRRRRRQRASSTPRWRPRGQEHAGAREYTYGSDAGRGSDQSALRVTKCPLSHRDRRGAEGFFEAFVKEVLTGRTYTKLFDGTVPGGPWEDSTRRWLRSQPGRVGRRQAGLTPSPTESGFLLRAVDRTKSASTRRPRVLCPVPGAPASAIKRDRKA